MKNFKRVMPLAALSAAVIGLASISGCSSSNEPVPVAISDTDIAQYEATMEDAEGGYEADSGNDDQ